MTKIIGNPITTASIYMGDVNALPTDVREGQTFIAKAGVVTGTMPHVTVSLPTKSLSSSEIKDPVYSNNKFTISVSGTNVTPSITWPESTETFPYGYIKDVDTPSTNTITGSKELNKIQIGYSTTGDKTTKTEIKRTQFSITGVTDASSGEATTTPPTSGVYVKTDAPGKTTKLTVNPNVLKDGYGTTAQYSAQSSDQTVGSSSADSTYIPIKTTSASVSGKRVSYESGWIDSGYKDVNTATAKVKSVSKAGINPTPSFSVSGNKATFKAVNGGTSLTVDGELSNAGWVESIASGTVTIYGSCTYEIDAVDGGTVYAIASKETAVNANVYTKGTIYIAPVSLACFKKIDTGWEKQSSILAAKSKILEDTKITIDNSNNEEILSVVGSMKDIQPTEEEINLGATYTIPQGYHHGTGTVTSKYSGSTIKSTVHRPLGTRVTPILPTGVVKLEQQYVAKVGIDLKTNNIKAGEKVTAYSTDNGENREDIITYTGTMPESKCTYTTGTLQFEQLAAPQAQSSVYVSPEIVTTTEKTKYNIQLTAAATSGEYKATVNEQKIDVTTGYQHGDSTIVPQQTQKNEPISATKIEDIYLPESQLIRNANKISCPTGFIKEDSVTIPYKSNLGQVEGPQPERTSIIIDTSSGKLAFTADTASTTRKPITSEGYVDTNSQITVTTPTITAYKQLPLYEGDTEITPGKFKKVLDTSAKYNLSDITINAVALSSLQDQTFPQPGTLKPGGTEYYPDVSWNIDNNGKVTVTVPAITKSAYPAKNAGWIDIDTNMQISQSSYNKQYQISTYSGETDFDSSSEERTANTYRKFVPSDISIAGTILRGYKGTSQVSDLRVIAEALRENYSVRMVSTRGTQLGTITGSIPDTSLVRNANKVSASKGYLTADSEITIPYKSSLGEVEGPQPTRTSVIVDTTSGKLSFTADTASATRTPITSEGYVDTSSSITVKTPTITAYGQLTLYSGSTSLDCPTTTQVLESKSKYCTSDITVYGVNLKGYSGTTEVSDLRVIGDALRSGYSVKMMSTSGTTKASISGTISDVSMSRNGNVISCGTGYITSSKVVVPYHDSISTVEGPQPTSTSVNVNTSTGQVSFTANTNSQTIKLPVSSGGYVDGDTTITVKTPTITAYNSIGVTTRTAGEGKLTMKPEGGTVSVASGTISLTEYSSDPGSGYRFSATGYGIVTGTGYGLVSTGSGYITSGTTQSNSKTLSTNSGSQTKYYVISTQSKSPSIGGGYDYTITPDTNMLLSSVYIPPCWTDSEYSAYGTSRYNAGKTQGAREARVGTAAAGQVLSGYTFTNSSSSGISGTMTNQGAWTSTGVDPGRTVYIPAGYHSGSGYVKTSDYYGNAGTDQVLKGYTFSNSSGKQTGTMTNNGAWTKTGVVQSQIITIPAGYHNGNGYVATASYSGNATPGDVLAEKTFTNSSGSGKIGTMANNGSTSYKFSPCESSSTHTIPAGYTSGGTINIGSNNKYDYFRNYVTSGTTTKDFPKIDSSGNISGTMTQYYATITAPSNFKITQVSFCSVVGNGSKQCLSAVINVDSNSGVYSYLGTSTTFNSSTTTSYFVSGQTIYLPTYFSSKTVYYNYSGYYTS